MNAKVREMVKEAIQSEGVEEILSDRYYGAVYILDIHKQTIIFWDGCNALKP